jgi:hypothetical protein
VVQQEQMALRAGYGVSGPSKRDNCEERADVAGGSTDVRGSERRRYERDATHRHRTGEDAE